MIVDETGSVWQSMVVFDVKFAATLDLAGYNTVVYSCFVQCSLCIASLSKQMDDETNLCD